MKKIFQFIFFLICSLAFVFASFETPTYALDNLVNNINYSSFGLSREFFDIFCSLSNTLNDSNRAYFDCRLFSASAGLYEDTTSTSSEASRIRNDLRSGVLNLSRGESGYACLKDLTPVTSLVSMSHMDFDGIKILILDNNSINSLFDSSFTSFQDLEEISIQNNNLSSFKMADDFYSKIKRLDLSGNRLTQADLSCMASASEVDLSHNLIDRISNITFGEFALSSLNLSFNNLTEEMDIDELSTLCSVKPFMAIQGLSKNRLIAGDAITIFNDGTDTRLAMDISYDVTSSFSGNILSSSGLDGFERIYLPAGKLFISFSYERLPDGTSMIDFASRSVSANLSKPTYYTTCDGVNSLATQYEKNFSLTIEDKISYFIPNKSTVESNYSLNIFSGSKLEGHIFNIARNGTVSFSAYFTFDSLDSDTLFVSVTKSNTSFITIAIIIVLGIIILSISGVTLFKFFKSGGQVAPLNDREMRSIRRKENKRYGNEYDFDSEIDIKEENVEENVEEELEEEMDEYLELDDEDKDE